MRDIPIANIIRPVKPLTPGDTIGKAAEALRSSGLGELPILGDGCVVGMLTEGDILRALSQGVPEEIASRPVSSIASQRVICITRSMPIWRAAEVLNEFGRRTLPVVDEYGGYLGVVTISDVASALCLTIRPPVVAGMATPLGVYLTTGHIRAGAGNLGLFLTGVMLMMLNYLAMGLVAGSAWCIQRLFGIPLWFALIAPAIHGPEWLEIAKGALVAAFVPVFLVLLRLAPLSGYHAAEHQVVHAIETGEPLTPERVKLQPRVHPRCGTNIVAGIALLNIIARIIPFEIATVVAIFILLFAWRSIGGYFQYYVTTKPANDRQIESAIRAGLELLEKYRREPTFRTSGWLRIWNTGMPQVMLGVVLMLALEQAFSTFIPKIF